MSFSETFTEDMSASPVRLPVMGNLEVKSPGISDFLMAYSGRTFSRGVYRIFDVADMTTWTEIVASAFPDFKPRIFCFGSDWLGRLFSLDFSRIVSGKPQILMIEPGTGECLEIPCDFTSFHHQELVEYPEEVLAVSFYGHWLQAGGLIPNISECIGYKKPLFLGGDDLIDNLELSDMKVYWGICAGLLQKTKDLPAGSKISDIDIQD